MKKFWSKGEKEGKVKAKQRNLTETLPACIGPSKLMNIQIFASMHFLPPIKVTSAFIFSSDLVNASWQQHFYDAGAMRLNTDVRF